MAMDRGIARAVALALLSAAVAAPASAQDGSTRTRRVTTPPAQGAASPRQPADEPLESLDGPIELSTDLVNVVFSVTDAKNKFVGDIKETELVVKEAGEAQRVFSFRRETNLPLSVALLIDVSASQEFTFEDEKRYAAEFLQKVLRPKQDSAAILRFSDGVELVQGMTSRLERVHEAFNRMQWDGRFAEGPRAGATAVYDSVYEAASDMFPPDTGRDDPANVVRRAIILLTDGDDTASERKLQEAVDEALRQGVIVYTIGVGDRYRSVSVKKKELEALSTQTGGRAYFPTSAGELGDAFSQIEQELRSQYVLAYEPSRLVRDGSFRAISISVPGRPEVRVVHRKGYFAPKPDGAQPTTGARK